MSVFEKIKSVPYNLPHGTAPVNRFDRSHEAGTVRKSLTGVLVDKGERYGAAWAFGALKGYYADRFMYRGMGYDFWAGIAGLATATLLQTVAGGNSKVALHLERLGDAGLSSYLNSMGAHWGMTKAGRDAKLLPPSGGKKPPAIRGDILGMIPPAMGGSYLNADDIARYSSAR
jgi:hypothetical protein